MRYKLSIKTLLRTPAKTIIMLLLMIAVTFALFYRIAGHMIVTREIDRAVSFYHGFGALDVKEFDTTHASRSSVLYCEENEKTYSEDMKNKYKLSGFPSALTRTQIEAFASLPQVTSVDYRYMTAGVSDSLFRLDYDDESYNHTNRFIMEGTFVEYTTHLDRSSSRVKLVIEDAKFLAGGEEILNQEKAWVDIAVDFNNSKKSGYEVIMDLDIVVNDDGSMTVANSREPDMYRIIDTTELVNSHYNRRDFIISNDYPYFNQDFLNGLHPGDRLLLIGRYEPRNVEKKTLLVRRFVLTDYFSSQASPLWNLNELPENYLETDEFAPVRELMEIINRDFHTFDMVYTSDMASIPRFANKKMLIAQGRMLNSEDTEVCVVSEKFLQKQKLQIGDVITMSLGDRFFEQYSTLGAVAVTHDRYGPLVETVNLTIVGSYTDTDLNSDRMMSAYKSYSLNTIFLPVAMLPVEPPTDHMFKPGEFSFIVADAYEIEEARVEAQKLADEMGYNLLYDDSNWNRAGKDLAVAERSSLITTILYIGTAAAGMYLALYLLIGRGKRTYAIARALGAPPNRARTALLNPLCFLSALAIPIGGAAGLLFATQTTSDAVRDIMSATPGFAVSASLPVSAILVSLFFELAFITLITGIMMRRLGRTPTLMLLQGDNVKKQKSRKNKERKSVRSIASAGTENIPEINLKNITFTFSDKPRHGTVLFMFRNAVRHIQRAGLRSGICVLLSVLLCCVMGALAMTRTAFQEMRENVEVKVYLIGATSIVIPGTPQAIVKDSFNNAKSFYYRNYFSNLYYENEFPEKKPQHQFDLVVTNDIARSIGSSGSVEDFGDFGRGKCVLGKEAAEALEVQVGNMITLVGYIQHGDVSIWNDSALDSETITRPYNKYTVGGIIPDGGMSVFVTADNARKIYNQYNEPHVLSECEFTLIDNNRTDIALEYAELLVSRSLSINGEASYVMDTAELDNITRTINLLDVLLPVAVAAAALVGLLAPGVTILQSAKESALNRMLGFTKIRVRCMLALEHMLLCLAGLLIAAACLAAYDAALLVRSVNAMIFGGGLYIAGYVFAVIAAGIIITRRQTLELLQVKE